MGIEVAMGIIGFVLTAACSGVGGAFWIQSKGSERIEAVRRAADDRVDKIFKENKAQMELVLSHVQKVESVLNDMRADLPTRYVQKEDFLRLMEKVDDLRLEVFKVKESA